MTTRRTKTTSTSTAALPKVSAGSKAGEAPASMTAIWIKGLGEGMFPPANAGTVYSIQMWVNSETDRMGDCLFDVAMNLDNKAAVSLAETVLIGLKRHDPRLAAQRQRSGNATRRHRKE